MGKNYFILLLFLLMTIKPFTFPLNSDGDIRFTIDMVQFPAEGDKTYIEFYIKIPAINLKIKSEADLFIANTNFDVKIYDQDNKKVKEDNWNVNAKVKEYTKEKVFVNNYPVVLAPGRYRIEIIIKDNYMPDKTGKLSEFFNVREYSNKLEISDIILSNFVRKAEPTDDKFVLGNDNYVYPNPDRIFSMKNPLNIYFEVYNLTLVENYSNLSIECYIYKEDTIIFFFRKNVSAPGSNIFQIYDYKFFYPFLNFADEGEYSLRIKVTDNNTEETAEKEVEIRFVK